ncbi:MAG: hypothetical protein ACJAR1_000787 [Rubritalea sp.]|jgi:hypothetical protein
MLMNGDYIFSIYDQPQYHHLNKLRWTQEFDYQKERMSRK